MKVLSDARAAAAVPYNNRKSRSLNWIEQFTEVCGVLGLPSYGVITGEGFAKAVFKFQTTRAHLSEDGKLGPSSWRAVEAEINQCMPQRTLPDWLAARPGRSDVGTPRAPASDATIAAGGGAAPWMDVALGEMNTVWRKDGGVVKEGSSTRDEDYFGASPYFGGKNQVLGKRLADNSHWCAAFANYCLHTAGYSHCGGAGATCFRWKSWWSFEVLAKPRRGCVIVVKGPNHVAFLDRWSSLPDNPGGDVENFKGRNLYLLGGNQSNTVKTSFEKRTMTSVTQNGVTSPYLWPLVGPNTCNCDLPTMRGHHCKAQWQAVS